MNQIKESIEEIFEEIDKESEEEFIEDLKEALGLNNKSTTDWYDKNKFNKILTTIDSNKFNHRNKIGKFKFNHINNLINNVKNNTISEADRKKKINELNKKKAQIKDKRLINGQKILLSLFDELLKAIFNNDKIVKEDNNKIVKEDNNNTVKEDNNVNDNDDNDDDYEDDYDDYDSDNDDEITVKGINNNFKKIDQTKYLKIKSIY